MKQVINLRKAQNGVDGDVYIVESLTNRMNPEIGCHLTSDQVQDFINDAEYSRGKNPLSVNIKGKK